MSVEQAPEYKEVANKLIDKFPVCYAHIEFDKILFLKDLDKTPKKAADIRRVGYPYNFLTEYKFIITVYEQITVGFNEAQKNMLIHHEMLHISEDFDHLNKHNIQDFAEIIAKYGYDWTINPNLPNILEDEEEPVKNVVNQDDDNDELEIL